VDIFDLQDELTQQIAAIVEPTLKRTEQQRLIAKPPKELAAWECCLKGYAYIYDGTKEGNTKAREMFNRAIELDPHYSRAYSGLAYTYTRDIRYFGTDDRQELMRLNFEAARRAVSLDESDAEARSMLVRAFILAKQPDAAISEARRAIELNPHDAFTNNTLGNTLALAAERYEEGIPWIERALHLNPLDPQQFLWLTHLAIAHLCCGHFEKAVERAQEAVRRNPEFLEARATLASALGFLGRPEEACAAIEGSTKIERDLGQKMGFAAQATLDRMLDGLRRAGALS
jgi:adenylate cyclase